MAPGVVDNLEHYTTDQLFQILDRIDFPFPPTEPKVLPPPTLKTLRQLHFCCVTTIPFETLSLRCSKDRTVDITLQGIFERIVNQKRGGWCFSVNRMLFEVLKGLGFTVQLAMARVTKPTSSPSSSSSSSSSSTGATTTVSGDDSRNIFWGTLTHRISIVRFLNPQTDVDPESGITITATVGSKWIFDIGYSTTSFYPIEISTLSPVTEYFGHRRRVIPTNHPDMNPSLLDNPSIQTWMMQEDLGLERGGWSPCYGFTEQEYFEKDCQVANFYSAKFPFAILVDQFWVIQGTKNGDYCLLMGKELKIRGADGTKKMVRFENEQQRLDGLKKYFGIVLTEEEMKWHDQIIVGDKDGVEMKEE